MSSWHTVRLIAMREIRERIRSRVFRITTVVSALIVAALIVLPNINDKRGGRPVAGHGRAQL